MRRAQPGGEVVEVVCTDESFFCSRGVRSWDDLTSLGSIIMSIKANKG